MQENVKDVFISYKAEEYDEAVNVKKRLEKEGISCWLAPGSIPGGSSYAVQIPKAIRECTAFVLILSKKAQESKWVPRELDQAINGGKTVLPFMIENCPLNDEFSFYLANVQRYNAWEDRNEAFDGMIREIRALLAEKRARESYTDAVLPDGEIRVSGQDNAETGKPEGVPGSLRVLPSGEVQVVGAGEDNSLVSGNAQGSLLPAADGQGDFALQDGGPSRRKGGRRAGRSGASDPEKQKKKGKIGRIFLIIAATAVIFIAGFMIRQRLDRIVIAGQVFSKKDTSVYLGGKTLTSDDVAKFRKFKELKRISLTECTFNAQSLSPLLSESLQTLELTDDSLTAAQAMTLDFTKAPNITNLNLSGNPGFTSAEQLAPLAERISILKISRTGISDISPLAAMSRLQFFSASDNGISDISPLAGLTALNEVTLNKNDISSLEPLEGCVKLTHLDISDNPLGSLHGIENILKLDRLYADRCGLKDLDALTNMTILRKVSVAANELTDIAVLGKSAGTLEEVYAWDNQLTEIECLADAAGLKKVYLAGNAIASIGPLENCAELKELNAEDNEITSLEGALHHLKLTGLDLSGNALAGDLSLSEAEWSSEDSVTLDLSNNRLSVQGLVFPEGMKFHFLDIHGNLTEGAPGASLYGITGRTLAMDYCGAADYQALYDAGFTEYYILDIPADKQVALEQIYHSRLKIMSAADFEAEKNGNSD